ncbi:MAG TPA: type III-B CRISPR module RAMP protein Cmr1 [Pseudonocardiaceae bacterium]|nr:type III-B CRISPR module RAMP protein Cmr1 [Pseudonocardiaceae bacterium]
MTVWTTLTLRVVTPLFSGDDPGQPDGGDPIRVPSIRGALRFWFRAVAAGHGVTDLAQLWAQEEQIFGSTRRPSAIALRVSGMPSRSDDRRPDWTMPPGLGAKDFHGAHYLLGMGLWRDGLTRQFVEPGRTFDLSIRFSRQPDAEQVNARFMLALWAWLTYGGLGARVRRGFGQLRCVGHSGVPLPGRWAPGPLGSPTQQTTWELYCQTPVPRVISDFAAHGWTGTPPPGTPEFPLLGVPAWSGHFLPGEPAADLTMALHWAGVEWRAFRAVADPAGPITADLHSPEWVHTIHGRSRNYPLAAFGLPVNYRGVTVDLMSSGQKIRRASPVWLRPVRLDGGWRTFTSLFRAQLRPPGAELSRRLRMPDDATIADSWDAWQNDQNRLPDDYY